MNAPARLLLVEDNPMDLDLALRAFKRHRPAVVIDVARDGVEALDWVQRWDAGAPVPSLILLDLKMPRVGGLEVLRQLKAHPIYRRIPVVMLTTSTESTDLRAAYDAHANSYLVKPVDFDRFMALAAQVDSYWQELNQSVG